MSGRGRRDLLAAVLLAVVLVLLGGLLVWAAEHPHIP